MEARHRSVNDYETTAELRCALSSRPCRKGCVADGEEGESDWMLYNYDKENSIPQKVDYELKRLQVLKSYHVLDAFSEEEQCFKRITNLAGRMFQCPMAVVTLIDMGRQYFISSKGLGDAKETPRNLSFCTHAILSLDDVFIVKDATKDPRFAENPFVTGEVNLRFYAGAPLVSPEGFRLGTICVLDTKPRPGEFTLDDKQNLREMAAVIVENMVDRRAARRRAMGQGMATTAHDLLAPVTSMQQNLLRALADKDNNRELLVTFLRCSEIMSRICHRAIFDESQATASVSGDAPLDAGAAASSLSPKRGKTKSSIVRDFQSSSQTAKIHRLVEDIESVVSPFPKRVGIHTDIDESLNRGEVYVGDDLKVARSAINLLVNACERADRGQISFRVFSKKSAADGEDLLVWEVEDNGPAIPIEQYPTLFQPVSTMMHHKTDEYAGPEGHHSSMPEEVDKATIMSDLGLLSVASNIDSLHGDYGFYSKEDGPLVGNVFWFAIPVKRRAVEDDPTIVDPFGNRGEVEEEEVEEALQVELDTDDPAVPMNTQYRGLGHHVHQDHTRLVPREIDAAIQHAEPPISLPMGGHTGDDFNPYDVAHDKIYRLSRNPNGEVRESTGDCVSPTGHRRRLSTGGSKDFEVSVPISVPTMEDMEAARALRGARASRARMAPPSGLALSPDHLQNRYATSHRPRRGSIPSRHEVQEQKAPPPTPSRRKALIVDDSITVRKCIDRTLTRLGYDVVQASNGMQGLKELRLSVFDVVFMDFLMPVVDGIDCVQQYREWESENRDEFKQYIVGMSSHSSDDAMVARGLGAGMDRFVSKPITSAIIKDLHASGDFKMATEAVHSHVLKTARDDDGDMTAGLTDDGSSISSSSQNSLVVIDSPKTPAVSFEKHHRHQRRYSTPEDDEYHNNPAQDEELAAAAAAAMDGAPPAPPPLCCLIGVSAKPAAAALLRCVEARGWRASTVEDGGDALRLLKMRRWDLVFLDDNMPRMSGAACVANFRQWEMRQGRDTAPDRQNHIYLLNERYSNGSAIMPAGADGVLGKPIKTKALVKILENASGGRGASKVSRRSQRGSRGDVRGMMMRIIQRK